MKKTIINSKLIIGLLSLTPVVAVTTAIGMSDNKFSTSLKTSKVINNENQIMAVSSNETSFQNEVTLLESDIEKYPDLFEESNKYPDTNTYGTMDGSVEGQPKNGNGPIVNMVPKLPYLINENGSTIRQLLIDKAIINAPKDITTDDIYAINISKRDNINGTITIKNIEMGKHKNSSGTDVSGVWTYKNPIVIKGFSKIRPTEMIETVSYNEMGITGQQPGALETAEQVKSYFISNIRKYIKKGTDVPGPSASVSKFENLVISKEYTLTMNIVLTSVFDSEGNYSTDESKTTFKMTVTDFPFRDETFNLKEFLTSNNNFWMIFISAGSAIVLLLIILCIIYGRQSAKRMSTPPPQLRSERQAITHIPVKEHVQYSDQVNRAQVKRTQAAHVQNKSGQQNKRPVQGQRVVRKQVKK